MILHQLWIKHKWRRLRLEVWKKRLQIELQETTRRYPLPIDVSLHISWGPFYNGSAIMNPRTHQAKIVLQLPYDRYVTKDETEVLAKFKLPLHHLPQFILNHEIYHLLDILMLMHNPSFQLKSLLKDRKQAVNKEGYRSLPFEESADLFAYSCFREKIRKAC